MENICDQNISFKIQRSSAKDSEHSQKHFSIIPDLITGWRPKALKIPPPILVKYKQNLVTNLINSLNNNYQTLVYLGTQMIKKGQRHYNSFSFHNKTQHDYNVRYCVKSQDLPESFQDELQRYKKQQNRPFVGMNPQINSEFIFESNFESGNLDAVIKITENQFDLYLRPDTNTCGHTQWFYFRVKLNQKASMNYSQNRIIKLNICNNKKLKTLFCKVILPSKQGMKPYVLSKYLKQKQGLGWHQEGNNVLYQRFIPRQCFYEKNDEISNQIDTIKQANVQLSNAQLKIQNQNHFKSEKPTKQHDYFSLSFQYQFQTGSDQVQFAYCPPYTYSDLKKDLFDLKKRVLTTQNCQIVQQKLCVSLSGLDVPLLTITDHNTSEQQKKVVVAVARFHPGQSNGSHVMKGFIQYLISEQAKQLRRNVTFKVIPMINPDGVISGNFRTSLSGKDLNRQFKAKKLNLLPQISSLKALIKKLKFEKGLKLSYFLDFHGHSIKKNTFVYGPEYDIWNIKYQKSRILPKLIAERTPMFRLKYCYFKVANYKRSTARAFMLSMMAYCYTVQSSIGIYQDQYKNNQNINFTILKWNEMGSHICQVLSESLQRLDGSTLNYAGIKNKRQKRNDKDKQKYKNPFEKQIVSQKETQKQNISSSTQIKSTQQSISLSKKEKGDSHRSLISIQQKPKLILCDRNYYSNLATKKYLDPIKNIKKRSVNLSQNQQFCKRIAEQDNQSDNQDKNSETKSDCQSESNDFSKDQYEKLNKDIQKVIQEFNKVIQNVSNKKQGNKFHISNKKKTITNKGSNKCLKNSSLTKSKYNNITEEMKLVPSLKHKLKKINFSQKKIGHLLSLQNSLTISNHKHL